MLGTMENYPFWGFSVRLRFADDHALDDRFQLAGYSLARPRGTGCWGWVGLGQDQTVAEVWEPSLRGEPQTGSASVSQLSFI